MKNIFKEKDNIILKEAAVTIMDNLVVAIDTSLNKGVPLLGIAYGLSKGLYGANIKLRQSRALEFVEMIRYNPDIFTKELLETEEFQDGFVYTFQRYLSERAEKKRQTIKNIFCGFSQEKNKPNFKLERLLYTLEQLSIEDIEVAKIFSDGTITKWVKDNYPEMTNEDVTNRAKESFNISVLGTNILSKMKKLKQFEEEDYIRGTLSRLSSLGLVFDESKTVSEFNILIHSFRESEFGKEFISYVLG